jgi:uroporphyrinogen decarboxylase
MRNERLHQSRFLKACRREPVDRTPVWLMRQAGRYMAEYRALRTKHTLLDLCKTPDLAAEVTMQPIRRFGFDAAIIFADILLPIQPMGLQLEFAKGEGPVIANAISSEADVDALKAFDVQEGLGFVLEAIRTVIPQLGDTPLIGFAGAPFTLASYMIEGGYSRHFLKTRKFMYEHPGAWRRLMDLVSKITAAYLKAQIAAGASAVQLFDSWVGILSPADYREFVLPYSQFILRGLDAPSIHFSTGTAAYLDVIAEAGGDVIGVDWRIELDQAWKKAPDRAIQGNLDPASLLRPAEQLRMEVRRILKQAGGKPGHIFNLGHGVYPEVTVENVELLVNEVHNFVP